ncbi:M23 family metallopeptidase [Spirochaetia bacterium 38H-sp]|uniref:M23 family metallopeptidase n=1 Tax=Rarispira pelagica TaxID=3141764 RepID=A0ABU9UBI7_9SPIR
MIITKKNIYYAALFSLTIICSAYAQYPIIKELSSEDPVFKQLEADIELFYKSIYQKAVDSPALVFFTYTPKPEESLIDISSIINISYDTIASLNHIQHPEELSSLGEIIIPNKNGLFIPEKEQNELERYLKKRERETSGEEITIIRNKNKEKFAFFPNDIFTPMERLYFLGVFFRFPIENAKITSFFGHRLDPFTGGNSFHHGIDVAAPVGTKVYPAQRGIVETTGKDSVLGLYIIIEHQNGYKTLYAHLGEIFVRRNQEVKTDTVIGTVGMTGKTTGPHLHFGIKTGIGWKDPLQVIKK